MTSGDEPRLPLPRSEREIGWYRDPHDPKAHRYWNGMRWSRSHPASEDEQDTCGADC